MFKISRAILLSALAIVSLSYAIYGFFKTNDLGSSFSDKLHYKVHEEKFNGQRIFLTEAEVSALILYKVVTIFGGISLIFATLEFCKLLTLNRSYLEKDDIHVLKRNTNKILYPLLAIFSFSYALYGFIITYKHGSSFPDTLHHKVQEIRFMGQHLFLTERDLKALVLYKILIVTGFIHLWFYRKSSGIGKTNLVRRKYGNRENST